jgi:hypothetical protein
MALTRYRLFQWKRWVELFFSVPNLLLPLFYKVSVVTMCVVIFVIVSFIIEFAFPHN